MLVLNKWREKKKQFASSVFHDNIFNPKSTFSIQLCSMHCLLYHYLWQWISFGPNRFNMEILVLHDWAILTYFTWICLLLGCWGCVLTYLWKWNENCGLFYRSKFWEKDIETGKSIPTGSVGDTQVTLLQKYSFVLQMKTIIIVSHSLNSKRV